MSEVHSRPLRHEIRRLVELTIPIVLVQTGLMSMGVVDTAMAGAYSPYALASVGLGHAYCAAVTVAIAGVLYALDALVSQAWGAGGGERLQGHVERGVGLALLLVVPAVAMHFAASPILGWLGQDPLVRPGAALYASRLAISVPAYLVFSAMRQVYQATDHTRAIVIAIIVANLFNVVANHALVFGNYGFPEMGIEGSALATSLSRWLLVAVFLVAGRSHRDVVGAPLSRTRHRIGDYGRMIGLGLPIAVQISLEMWVFTVVTMLMGQAGSAVLGGHIVALNLASLAFMLPLGIGMAAAARVGQALGAGDLELLRRRVRIVFTAGTAIQCGLAAVFLTVPRPLAALYTDDPEVLAVAVGLIRIAGVFQLADGLQVIAAGILRGIADTRIPALLALIGYWGLGLPIGLYLARRGGETDVAGYWWGLCAGLGAVAILLSLRIRNILRRPLEAVV